MSGLEKTEIVLQKPLLRPPSKEASSTLGSDEEDVGERGIDQLVIPGRGHGHHSQLRESVAGPADWSQKVYSTFEGNGQIQMCSCACNTR
jgi:hypothetical protein